MIKLILDYATWRCGKWGPFHLGEGNTCLRNREGFECCLGQFSPQMCPTPLPKEDLFNKGTPGSLNIFIPGLTKISPEHGFIDNTELSNAAMYINDSTVSTPDVKIEQLKVLFSAEGYEIEVINKPSTDEQTV